MREIVDISNAGVKTETNQNEGEICQMQEI